MGTVTTEALPSDLLADLGLAETPRPERLLTVTLVRFTPNVAVVRPRHPRPGDPEEMLMPVHEFFPDLAWAVGEDYVVEIVDEAPRPIVSTNRPSLVRLLLEGLCPAVRDGRVRVMGVARQPGVRAKVAVAATVPELDPVQRVIGPGGFRTRRLAVPLRGERLDVVLYDPDPIEYLRRAFAPARVESVRVEGPRQAVVLVAAHQMASAVGQGGLNTTLAGRITGWRVTVERAD